MFHLSPGHNLGAGAQLFRKDLTFLEALAAHPEVLTSFDRRVARVARHATFSVAAVANEMSTVGLAMVFRWP